MYSYTVILFKLKMNIIDILLDSPLYIMICEYLKINDIKNIFISNKKIFQNINNKNYTKKVMLHKVWDGINLTCCYKKLFSDIESNLNYYIEQHQIINKKLILHKKIVNISN